MVSTKKWIKCFPWENLVNLRGKSGDITCTGEVPVCVRAHTHTGLGFRV